MKPLLSRQDALWFTKVEMGPVALRQWLSPVMSPSTGCDPLPLSTASTQFSQVAGLLYAQLQSVRVGPAPNVVPAGKNCSTQLVVLTGPAPVTLAGTPACGDFAPLMAEKLPASAMVPS